MWVPVAHRRGLVKQELQVQVQVQTRVRPTGTKEVNHNHNNNTFTMEQQAEAELPTLMQQEEERVKKELWGETTAPTQLPVQLLLVWFEGLMLTRLALALWAMV